MADNVTRGSKISDCNIGEISKYSPYKYIIYIYIYPMEIMLLYGMKYLERKTMRDALDVMPVVS
jgi:hypothetical protein